MTTPNHEQAAKIAAGLTKAQRAAMTRWPKRDDGHVWAYRVTMAVLERLGLAYDRIEGSGWARLTPLGSAVRAILMESDDA